jgi:DNA-binding CsgD family transcriptional regulator
MVSQLIGRQAALEAGEGFLDALSFGPASLVIEGEPGIGKTTVWQAVLDSAVRRGFTTLDARPTEAEAELSLVGLTDLLADLADEIAPALPAPQRKALAVALLKADPDGVGIDARALGTAVISCLDRFARHGPVVVAIDDFQWLDRATARALELAFRRLRRQPVGILIAMRRDPVEHPSLARAVQTTRVGTLRLGPLSLASLHHLVQDRFGLSLTRPTLTRLEQASGGNPLLALEIVDAVRRDGRVLSAEEILPAPVDMQHLVATRLASLSPRTYRTVLTCAALGRPRLEELRAALSGQNVDAHVRQAVDAGLIVIEDGRVRFSHPIFASAVYAAAGSAERQRLHGHLSSVARSPEEAARHLALATDTPSEDVAMKIDDGAQGAAARGAPDVAASLLEHALRLTPADATSDRARRGLLLAHYLWEIGDVARSRALIEDVIATLPAGRDRAMARLLVAAEAAWTEGPQATIDLCCLALADTDDPILQATIHLRAAYAADSRLAVAARHARTAMDILERSDPPAARELLACALLVQAELRLRAGGRHDERAVARARALLPPLPNPPVRPLAFNTLGIARERDWLIRAATDDLNGARDLLEALYRHDRESGLDRAAPIQLCDLAELECWLGNVTRAAAHAAAASELAEQTGATPFALGYARVAEAVVAIHQGDLDRAERASSAAGELATSIGDPFLDARARALRGSVAFLAGRPGDAVADFELARAALARSGTRHPAVFRFGGDEIEALTLLGARAEALARLDVFEAGARGSPTPWTRAIGARSRALLVALDGGVDDAIRLLEKALLDHAALAMPLEHGRTLLLKGRLHRRRKEKRVASETLREALELFEPVHARVWIERTRAELDRVGIRPAAPDELTATEERVAELAASGMTNRQVADAVVLSPKSIDGVLSRIYRKLDITSRAQLGAWMAGRVTPGGRGPAASTRNGNTGHKKR